MEHEKDTDAYEYLYLNKRKYVFKSAPTSDAGCHPLRKDWSGLARADQMPSRVARVSDQVPVLTLREAPKMRTAK